MLLCGEWIGGSRANVNQCALSVHLYITAVEVDPASLSVLSLYIYLSARMIGCILSTDRWILIDICR